MAHNCEIPPPPDPPLTGASFHTFSVGGGPIWDRVVPPTPVTSGWLEGSSTARAFDLSWGWQSSEPLSPAAATTLWPWTAASWNSVFSASAAEAPSSASHSPHDVEMTSALSATGAVMMALYVSYTPDA